MLLSKKVFGKRFVLLAALVAALVIACTGVVLAQGSTANPGYEKTNPGTPSDAAQADASPITNSSSATNDFSAASRVSNGGFETGDLSGWNVLNQNESEGGWYAYSGTTSPLTHVDALAIAAPPSGSFAATTDQYGPGGSHVLYKDIRLKRNMKHKLSFFLYYDNKSNPGAADAGAFYTPIPNTLDYAGESNQQYRVDVLKRSADPFSVDPSDVLATIFSTKEGDPSKLEPTLLTFNLTRFAGKTVRLRFAEVDNEGFFLASVDRVKVTSKRR
jgi:hypothetical protein